MTITQLLYFEAAVRESSLTKVAELFHVSQPAVSGAIRELEKEFHVVLFQRIHRKIVLTPEGQRFYQESCKLTSHYQIFCREMQEQNVQDKAIRFGIAPILSALYLPRLYRYLQEKMPDLRLDTQENRISDVLDMLKLGLLDIICIEHEQPLPDPSWRSVTLKPLELPLCIHRDLASFPHPAVSCSDIRSIPLVLQRQGTLHNRTVRAHFAMEGLEPNVLCEAGQIQTMREMVLNGLAGSFLPPYLFRHTAEIGFFTLKGFTYAPICLIWKNDTPFVQQTVRILSGFFRENL